MDTLSRDDLYKNPELVQPLGTKKGVRNKPTEIIVDLRKMFLSGGNISMLFQDLYTIYQQTGGKLVRSDFYPFIKEQAIEFAKITDFNSYCMAEYQAVGFNNYVESLKAINQDFRKHCYNYFAWNVANPFKDDVEVGTYDERVLKKGYELTPDDHGTLEVWREQFTQVLNRNFRDQNRIPRYRESIHTRPYARDNEGLRDGDSDRASLENLVRGYDMSQIYKNLDRYSSEEWYSM